MHHQPVTTCNELMQQPGVYSSTVSRADFSRTLATMSDKVPAEFVGKARVFRANMLAATTGVGSQMRAISQYSFDLYKRRNSSPRPEHLVSIEQQWR